MPNTSSETSTMETDEDWTVDCSDDEKYSYPGAEKGVWEPLPKDIKDLYEKLAAGEELKLSWSWPRGRRSPSPEPCEENMDEDSAPKEVLKEEKHAPTEFDFDDFGDTTPKTILTPRRTPGSKTPRSTQKRVARMDKIMDDLRKEKKSMSPGQKTMVPGHRPLPGLGGANRLTPKPGMFGSPAQRTPPAAAPGGPRPASAQKFQSPTPAQVPQTVGSSQNISRPPLSSDLSTEAARESANTSATEAVTAQPVATTVASSVSTPTTPKNDPSVIPPSPNSKDYAKPVQAITVVQPTPGDGTPQRPALPKLKIRKDLIS